MSEELIFGSRREAAVYANQHGLIVVELEDGRFGVEAPPEPDPVDMSAFDAACEAFRAVCKDIGDLIGAEDFRGGFDEFMTFKSSEKFNTLEGLHLAMEWSAANELCKYEGSKIGLGQPGWWKACWQRKALPDCAAHADARGTGDTE